MLWISNGALFVENDYLLMNIYLSNFKSIMVNKMKVNKFNIKWNTYLRVCKEWENGCLKLHLVTVQNCIGNCQHKK